MGGSLEYSEPLRTHRSGTGPGTCASELENPRKSKRPAFYFRTRLNGREIGRGPCWNRERPTACTTSRSGFILTQCCPERMVVYTVCLTAESSRVGS